MWCECNTIETPDDLRCAIWGTVPRPWNDWGDGAAWLGTVWASHESWKAARGRVHPLFLLAGFSFFMFMADSLHIMELGVVHRALGNVFFHLCYTTGLLRGATPNERLDHLWCLILLGYERLRTPVQLGNLKLPMFCKPDGPYSKQPELIGSIKAAESKHLAPVVRDLFSTVARAGSAIDAHIHAMLHSLAMNYKCLEDKSVTLPLATQDQVKRSIWRVARHYEAAGAWARREGWTRRWGITNKFHMMLHLGIQAGWLNPRPSWTYIDEDFIS